MRAGIVGVTLLLIAALLYDGASHRYSVERMNSDTLVRVDHLTGRSEACTIDDVGGVTTVRCQGDLPPDDAEFRAWKRARGARP